MQFPERASGSKNFLKLKSGESVRGIFQGDVYTYRQHWSQAKKTGIPCIGEGCPICAEVTDDMSDDEKKKRWPSFRFRVNFIVAENGAYSAKIFEQGGTVYDSLKALHEGDYDLSKNLMKITRHGSGNDTTYAIVPVPNGTLDEAKIATIKQVDLCELKHNQKANPEGQRSDPFASHDDDDEIPF